MRLAVYITGHGYGHLTRTMEICRELLTIKPDTEIHIRTDFPAYSINEALGQEPASFEAVRLDIGLVQVDSLSWDNEKSIEKLEYYFGAEGDKLVETEAQWLIDNTIDAALVDISPRAFDACYMAGIPAYGSTNFSWDWIWDGIVDDEPRMKKFSQLAQNSYSKCTLLFRTVMDKGLSAFPDQERVPLVARISRRDRNEVRDLIGIDREKLVVILSYGGEGLKNTTLPPLALHEKFQFIATEPMENPGEPFLYISDKQVSDYGLRYCDLINAVDIVMTKPGYSTIAESVANKSAMIYSDRGNFREYPVIVDYIQRFLPNEFLSSGDLKAGLWSKALDALLQKLPFSFPETDIYGARYVAKRLIELT